MKGAHKKSKKSAVFRQSDWKNFMVAKALGKGNIFYKRKLFQGDQYDVLDDGDGFMNIYIYENLSNCTP